MKTHLFLSLFLIFTIFTNHHTKTITIEQPTKKDYQQTFAVIDRVGIRYTYKAMYQEILSPEQEQDVSHSYESTVFQAMWNNRNNRNNYFFVAKDKDNVIGMIYAIIEKDNFYNAITGQSLVLKLDEIYILPSYQNKGIGQLLISTILNAAKNDNPELNTIMLRVLENNAQAIRCYEKAGFETKELIMYKKL